MFRDSLALKAPLFLLWVGNPREGYCSYRVLARRVGSYLDRLPDRWSGDLPREEDFDPDLQRIASPSPRRPDHGLLRFRTEGELRRELGPAGPGREWHHIVEKRLAGNRFPAALIHSTDKYRQHPDRTASAGYSQNE